MFRRRSPKTVATRARAFIWPERGWSRTGQYVLHRIQRMPGSPYSIAAGFACGAAFSVTPLVGAHFFLAAFVAWMMRANVLAAAFGTVVGNPWTFPFIWLTSYHTGRVMLGHGISGDADLDFTGMFTGLVQSMIEADAAVFSEQVWPIWLPMFVGSLPWAALTAAVVYAVFFRLVEGYQKNRLARRIKRQPMNVEQRQAPSPPPPHREKDAA